MGQITLQPGGQAVIEVRFELLERKYYRGYAPQVPGYYRGIVIRDLLFSRRYNYPMASKGFLYEHLNSLCTTNGIASSNRDNWKILDVKQIWGVPKRNKNLMHRVKPGDTILVYVR
ncbi:MAG: EVE domain-containing protein, partial [Methanomicrobiales archaeon]|nr:EVE domain-containing protein [Methanomicrobiales archaeon]